MASPYVTVETQLPGSVGADRWRLLCLWNLCRQAQMQQCQQVRGRDRSSCVKSPPPLFAAWVTVRAPARDVPHRCSGSPLVNVFWCTQSTNNKHQEKCQRVWLKYFKYPLLPFERCSLSGCIDLSRRHAVLAASFPPCLSPNRNLDRNIRRRF